MLDRGVKELCALVLEGAIVVDPCANLLLIGHHEADPKERFVEKSVTDADRALHNVDNFINLIPLVLDQLVVWLVKPGLEVLAELNKELPNRPALVLAHAAKISLEDVT
jgi:hypothetical protein